MNTGFGQFSDEQKCLKQRAISDLTEKITYHKIVASIKIN